MQFRTEIFPDKPDTQIKHSERILTIGSCFADNISHYLSRYKFKVLGNPFGVLYNPVSILNSINIISNQRHFSESDLIHYQEEYHSFYHHSSFSHHEKQKCLDNINSMIDNSSEFLKAADWIIITLGTSYIYNYIESGQTVSNCHKLPSKMFNRKKLSMQEISESLSKIIMLLNNINSENKVIITVSPIRHWRDGAVDNQISKAQLILAVSEIVKSYKNCTYFPAYEILMDDLRDYRFYESDLLHPNKIATDYIWEKFYSTMLTDECKALIDKIRKIDQAFSHRVRNPKSKNHQEFLISTISAIEDLTHKYEHIDFTNELRQFKSQLI